VPLGVRAARFTAYFAFAAVLVVLTFIDLDTKRLPDVITLPSVAVFYLAGFAVGGAGWLERAIGAAGGYLVVRIIADVYYYSTGREGLGLGDGKLLAFMGALLGWKALPPIIFGASFVGILVSVPVLLARRRRDLREAGAPVAPRAEPPAPAEPAMGLAVAPAVSAAEASAPEPAMGLAVAPAVSAAEASAPARANSSALPSPAEVPAGETRHGDAEPPPTQPFSIRKAEVPFGPFLAASALAYLFLHQQVWALLARLLIGEW
jgi:prepilin signal peptidase PulO-like enzyme (type II secretory pathway)